MLSADPCPNRGDALDGADNATGFEITLASVERGIDQPRAQPAAGSAARRLPLKTAFGGTNHHHGPCEPSLRSLRTGLRRGGAKIPEIRIHPPETGPQNRPENRVNTPPKGAETLSGSASL